MPKDATGNVTVKITGQADQTVIIGGGKGVLVVENLKVGSYDVSVVYNGDGKYLTSNNATKFAVKPVNTTPEDIGIEDTGNGTIVITVPENATGNVTVIINNQTVVVNVTNGTAVVNLTNLTNVTPGEYNVTIIYSGDENNTNVTINKTVTIPKHATPISVEVTDIKVGDVETVVVNVPEGATGNVTITIDGETYTSAIENGRAIFNVENLLNGTKTIVVNYMGDKNFTNNNTLGKFTVSKRDSTVTISVADISVGDNAVISVKVPANATGYVVVEINDVQYAVNLTEGEGSIEIEGLSQGIYDIKAIYLGDDQYLESENATTVKVDKVPSDVEAAADDITVGEKAIIEINLPSDATGVAVVTIDGKDYNVTIGGGKGVLVVPGLKVGSYDVSVKYNGDKKYIPSSSKTAFTVKPVNTTADDVKVTDNGNGTVVITVPENATGNVTVIIDGKNYTANVTNGTAVVDLGNSTPGEHNITVIYSGDENHTAIEVNKTITIPKYETPISIDVKDAKVGETVTVTVSVPGDSTGKVKVEIDGKTYTADVKDGKAVVEVKDLLSGNKTVTATYVGDKNYLENTTTATFEVSKNKAEIKVTAEENVVKVEVTPADATGYVIVNVDGVDYGINITNGESSVEIPDLKGGDYTVKATYLGDEKYLEAVDETEMSIAKDPNMNVTIKDTGDGGADVTVTLPDDATGNITVNIDGKNYTVPAKGGENTIHIPDLGNGEHTANVTYSGDDKYDGQSVEKTFNTTKKSIATILVVDPTFSRQATDYYAGERGDMFYGVLMDTNGNVLPNKTVQIAVNGPIYNVTTDEHGRAGLMVNLMNANIYTYALFFAGDDTYNASHIASSKLTVFKKKTTLAASNVQFKKSTKTKVVQVTLKTVKNPFDGKTYLKSGKKITLKVNGKTYKAKINKKGVATFKVKLTKKGKYVAKIKFAGDKTYEASSKNIKITIK